MPTGSLHRSRRARTSTRAVCGAQDRKSTIPEHDARIMIPVQLQATVRAVVQVVDLLDDHRMAVRTLKGRVSGIDEKNPATGTFSLVADRLDEGGERGVGQGAVETALLSDIRSRSLLSPGCGFHHIAKFQVLEDQRFRSVCKTFGDCMCPSVAFVTHFSMRRSEGALGFATSCRGAFGCRESALGLGNFFFARP